MSDDLSHYATCKVWETGSWAECDCKGQPPWRIRKEDSELFPWRIWRYTDDGTYEHLMRCSSWSKAMSMVDGFMGIRRQALTQQLSERSAMWTRYRPSMGDTDV